MTAGRLKLGLFRDDESGSTTIEFVIFFPIVLSLFMMAFELGLTTTRSTMLERGTDLVVRDLRLGTGTVPDYETIRDRICNNAKLIPNCAEKLRVELRSMPAADWSSIDTVTRCINREEEVDPSLEFRPGLQNELMIIRVCALFEPIFPTTGLAYRIAENPEGHEYAIRTTAAFVNEPDS